MSALENFRMVLLLYLRLCMFADVISSKTAVAHARLLEPELCHDGSEAAGVGVFLQVAVHHGVGSTDHF